MQRKTKPQRYLGPDPETAGVDEVEKEFVQTAGPGPIYLVTLPRGKTLQCPRRGNLILPDVTEVEYSDVGDTRTITAPDYLAGLTLEVE